MTADMGFTGGVVSAERVILVGTDGVPYSATGGGGGAGDASAANQVLEIAALGAPADTESTSGNGTIIAILKNLRTRIASVVTLLGGGLPVALGGGGGLKVDGSGTALPVSGTVTANAGTGTLAVSGPVTDTQLRATAVPVSGTVTANAGTGTLAVSAASLPLPSGAATAAKQPALGTAGSAATDVLSVQGIASGTALKTDGSATTQPVSGTVTANAGTGTFGTNMAQVAGTTTDTNSGVKSAGTQRFVIATDQPQLTNALKVDGSAVTQPVSGTVTSTPTSYSAPVSGELIGVTSATVLPTITCKMVQFVATAANTGKVYLGGTGVTKVDGSTDTTTGLQLSPGQSTGWIPLTNLNVLFRICDNTTDTLTYLALN